MGHSLSAAGEREAAGKYERGSESGCGADAGIAPVEAAVIDPDDERDLNFPGPGPRRDRADCGGEPQGGEDDRGDSAKPTRP